jgi:hypothetical protein
MDPSLPVLDEILEHEKDLHDEVQKVLPARLCAWLQLVDVGGEVGGAHQLQHAHHVAHQGDGVPVVLKHQQVDNAP